MHTVTSCLVQQLTSTVRQRGKVGGRRGRRGEVSREGEGEGEQYYIIHVHVVCCHE